MVTGYFDQNTDFNLMSGHEKKSFLGFYNLLLLAGLKLLLQKLFGTNLILLFNSKLATLWILFKLLTKINTNDNY